MFILTCLTSESCYGTWRESGGLCCTRRGIRAAASMRNSFVYENVVIAQRASSPASYY